MFKRLFRKQFHLEISNIVHGVKVFENTHLVYDYSISVNFNVTCTLHYRIQ
jgi:hypothetical protein